MNNCEHFPGLDLYSLGQGLKWFTVKRKTVSLLRRGITKDDSYFLPRGIDDYVSQRIKCTSHDINTILAVCGLELRRPDFELNGEFQSELDLAEDILRYSFAAFFGKDGSLTEVFFPEFLRQTTLFWSEALDFEISCDSVGLVSICRGAIAVLMYNLLQNAQRARTTEVAIKVEKEGGYLCLEVKDRGLGMNEANKKKLLRRYRGEVLASQDDYENGHNLGSTNIGRIISRCQGEVAIESKTDGSDHGTTVMIRLPLEAGE